MFVLRRHSLAHLGLSPTLSPPLSFNLSWPYLTYSVMFSGRCVWLGTALLPPPLRDAASSDPFLCRNDGLYGFCRTSPSPENSCCRSRGEDEKGLPEWLIRRCQGLLPARPPGGVPSRGAAFAPSGLLPPFDTVLSAYSYQPTQPHSFLSKETELSFERVTPILLILLSPPMQKLAYCEPLT